MNLLHLIMLKLLKGATAVVTVITICNHDVYRAIVNIATDVLTAITATQDVLMAIIENTDVRKTISTDPTDVLLAITINTDVLGEVC